jgi:hypothetical protein
LIILIIILFCVKYIDYKQFKFYKTIGDRGENIVYNKLKQLGQEYIIQNNVYLGKAQIDHMVIHHRDIFVIETKLWGGIITGQYNDKKWQQNINNNIKYLNNPILQNQFHCSQVKKAYPGYKIYSIVVFVNNNNVPKYSCIVSVNNLLDFIKSASNKYSNRLPAEV